MVSNNFYALLRHRFSSRPRKAAVQTPFDHPFSYAELDYYSSYYAQAFLELGIRTGDRIVVQIDKSPYALLLYLACLRSGLIYVPLNTAYPDPELDYFLGDAQPALFICRPHREEDAKRLAMRHSIPHIYTMDTAGLGSWATYCADAINRIDTFVETPVSVNDGAVMLYTSGTTGRPKGAVLSHGNLAANGLALQQAWGFTAQDVLLHALPIFHAHGLLVACHCVWLSGSTMILLPQFDVETVIKYIPHATVLMGVPTYYTRLLAHPDLNESLCQNMRLFISGSAPLRADTFKHFQKRTGHAILERYGMSETGMNLSNPLNGERIAGSVGMPLPGVSIRIVDEQHQEVATGVVGHLWVKGAHVFQGYWQQPAKTAESFTADGYFITGDLARREPNGYITLVGREKDVIITGGYNVYAAEVERCLEEQPGVLEAAVIGIPHTDFGETVIAFVVREANTVNTELLTEKMLIETIKTQLANYKVPKRIVFCQELPRNAMGKVQKQRLREQLIS